MDDAISAEFGSKSVGRARVNFFLLHVHGAENETAGNVSGRCSNKSYADASSWKSPCIQVFGFNSAFKLNCAVKAVGGNIPSEYWKRCNDGTPINNHKNGSVTTPFIDPSPVEPSKDINADKPNSTTMIESSAKQIRITHRMHRNGIASKPSTSSLFVPPLPNADARSNRNNFMEAAVANHMNGPVVGDHQRDKWVTDEVCAWEDDDHNNVDNDDDDTSKRDAVAISAENHHDDNANVDKTLKVALFLVVVLLLYCVLFVRAT